MARELRLVVAGSTLEGEEAALLEAWPRLLVADPQLAMVLAPRHPERFAAVAALLEKSGNPLDAGAPTAGRRAAARPAQIVLLDTIGELASVYSLAASRSWAAAWFRPAATIRWSRRSSACRS